MARKTRPRMITVFNTTGDTHVFNAAGSFIFPGESREVDPNDPYTQALLAKGSLIIQEG